MGVVRSQNGGGSLFFGLQLANGILVAGALWHIVSNKLYVPFITNRKTFLLTSKCKLNVK
jgi:hypothetical protein